MGHGVGLNLFRSPEGGPFAEIRRSGRKMYHRKFQVVSKKSAKNTITQLRLGFPKICYDFGNFLLGPVGFRNLTYRSERFGKSLPVPTKTGCPNWYPSLISLGGYISYSSRDLTERLFAWSFRVSVSAGLRWGDLINTSPPTTVLMK